MTLPRITDKIINVSEYEYNNAVKVGIPLDKMCVIYNGIYEKKEKVNYLYTINKDVLNFLFVGKFDPQKGIDFLLDVFDECQREDIHLYVIGDNVVSSGMGVKKENTDKVIFLGWMNHRDIAFFYEHCNAVIMPSRWEAFGLVAIEAMKYGKPVIASNRGALPELIKPGINGFLFDYKVEDDLLNVIYKIKKSDLDAMAEYAECEFKKRFTADKMLKLTNNVYINKGS